MSPTRYQRAGWTTTVHVGEVHFAIFASSKVKLRDAFIQVTGGRVYFDPEKIDRAVIYPSRTKEVTP